MNYKADTQHIVVRAEYTLDGDTIVEVDCTNYDTFAALPSVIKCGNLLLGKTGWSSDRNYACYKSNVRLAEIVK